MISLCLLASLWIGVNRRVSSSGGFGSATRAVDPCDLGNAAAMDDGCPVCMQVLSPDLFKCGERVGDKHNPCVVLLSQPGKGKGDCVDLGGHAGER